MTTRRRRNNLTLRLGQLPSPSLVLFVLLLLLLLLPLFVNL
jgi:hypothetical protein